jgi:hypothetical protein
LRESIQRMHRFNTPIASYEDARRIAPLAGRCSPRHTSDIRKQEEAGEDDEIPGARLHEQKTRPTSHAEYHFTTTVPSTMSMPQAKRKLPVFVGVNSTAVVLKAGSFLRMPKFLKTTSLVHSESSLR